MGGAFSCGAFNAAATTERPDHLLTKRVGYRAFDRFNALYLCESDPGSEFGAASVCAFAEAILDAEEADVDDRHACCDLTLAACEEVHVKLRGKHDVSAAICVSNGRKIWGTLLGRTVGVLVRSGEVFDLRACEPSMVGHGDGALVVGFSTDVQRGDFVVLCSSSILGLLGEAEVVRRLKISESPKMSAITLVEAALEKLNEHPFEGPAAIVSAF